MSMLPCEWVDFDDHEKNPPLTKQSYAEELDVNRIIARHAAQGTLPFLHAHQGEFGDFADFDFQEAHLMIARAKSLFYELPANVRAEFNGDPGAFFDFVNDPENSERLAEVLPALAQPGLQLPDVTGSGRQPVMVNPDARGSARTNPSTESNPPVTDTGENPPPLPPLGVET